jgi:ribosomal protein S18 acetylase RimI-like enzyme
MVPEAERRAVCLPTFFRLFGEVFIPQGETYVTADGTGVAMWAPPEAGPGGVPEELLDDFSERLGDLLGEDAERAGELTDLQVTHDPEAPYYFLQFLGVAPEAQGRGVGGRLMEEMAQRCDTDGVGAYLEATNEQACRFYARHGFVTLGTLELPGLTQWRMWREPHLRSAARG